MDIKSEVFMRVCKYCETESKNDEVNCSSCGANNFSNKCNNCNTIFDTAFCPTCGIKADEKPITCTNCGAESYRLFCHKCGAALVRNKNIRIDTTPKVVVPHNTKNNGCIVSAIICTILIICFGVLIIKIVHDATETATNIIMESDLDIVKKEGHPLFYGNFQEAKDFWKGYKKVKVVNAQSKIYNEDALLLITTGNEDNGIITDVSFNFSNIENKDSLNVEEVLKIVCGYIPYDILDKYYDYKTSFKATYHEEGGYVAYHYVMKLNKNGEKLTNTNYQSTFAFKIYCRDKNNWLAEINILAADGNYSKWEKGSYYADDWKVDINSYEPLDSKLERVGNRAENLYSLAQTYYKEKSYGKAKEVIAKLLQKHPDSEEAKKANKLLLTIENEIKKEAEKQLLIEKQKEEANKKRLADATKKMRKQFDEVQEITWYYNKSTPEYANKNNFYIYIGTKKDSLPWLRLKIQYAATDWLFIDKYIFKVDDKTFEINPVDSIVIRDNNADGIWEVYDDEFNKKNYDLVKAIISSKKAIVRHQGNRKYADRVITTAEKQGLKNVLDVYEALDGKISF